MVKTSRAVIESREQLLPQIPTLENKVIASFYNENIDFEEDFDAMNLDKKPVLEVATAKLKQMDDEVSFNIIVNIFGILI